MLVRVAQARQRQYDRYNDRLEGEVGHINARVDGELLDEVAMPDEAGKALLFDAAKQMKLSARGYHRVLRVARTLADLEGVDQVTRPHIAEAISYRRIQPRA